MSDITLYLGDCLELMGGIPAGSVDLVLCDLPYGTTACAWDSVIPFEPLWGHYKRLLKAGGAVVLTASQPFTSALVMSNPKWFRYELICDKSKVTGFLDAKLRPLKRHEGVCVFFEKFGTYNPQMTRGKPHLCGGRAERSAKNETYGAFADTRQVRTDYYPASVLSFPWPSVPCHPNEKPVSLFEYLVRTYSNEGDVVLDNTMGSGTTGVACVNTSRAFIGVERDPTYFAIAEQRVADARLRLERPHAPPLRLKPEPVGRSLFDAFEEAS